MAMLTCQLGYSETAVLSALGVNVASAATSFLWLAYKMT
jgi:hypothetical protein